MENLIRCAKCKKVSFVISKEKATKDCVEYEKYYNQSTDEKKSKLEKPTGLDGYKECPYCGDSYKKFTYLSQEEKDKLPMGITISPVLDPNEE